MGARLVSTTQPETVGSLVIAGDDFPVEVVELIRGWGVSQELVVKDGKSTRGLLEYHDADFGRGNAQLCCKGRTNTDEMS